MKLTKATQEQAVAAWLNYQNQLRLDHLLGALHRQDVNLEEALASVDEALKKIDLEVVATNRGGLKGMHGFIAEVAEVGIGNARSRILGDAAPYRWVNDNGPVDLMRDTVQIQQKFVAAGGRFGLGAIQEHLRRYPDFVRNGGKYQIPADHFEVIRDLWFIPRSEAETSLTRGGDSPSIKDWEQIQQFFKTNNLDIGTLEPSTLNYRDVQQGTFRSTLNVEKESLKSTDKSVRQKAHRESRPTLEQGATATLSAASFESITSFALAVIQKRREGTKLKDFTRRDWATIAGASGVGFVSGGVRGLTVLAFTNFTASSAAVASSVVTTAFGIAELANRLRREEIDDLQFIEMAELITLEAAVNARWSVRP